MLENAFFQNLFCDTIFENIPKCYFFIYLIFFIIIIVCRLFNVRNINTNIKIFMKNMTDFSTTK